MTQIEEITNFYKDAFQALNKNKPTPEINVRFYPYIGINHTIRVRDGKIFVRLAELCQNAPSDAQKSLAYILVGKILRKKIPDSVKNVYKNFAKTAEMREKAIENKRKLGHKKITSANGETYDLNKIFESLNLLYFENSIPKPVLSWSQKRTYRILGHYDSAHETIIVSKSLDDKNVPQFVAEYVLFHEMLHIFHPTEHRNGRRCMHTAKFKRDEKKFAYFEEAENWIERNIKNLKRKAKKKKI